MTENPNNLKKESKESDRDSDVRKFLEANRGARRRNYIHLSEFSTESLEVMNEFGPNAAAHLNQYCIALEDALLETTDRLTELQEKLEQLENKDKTEKKEE